MDDQTRENLEAAMSGEANAYARYTLAAAQARAGGREALAALYEETAEVELHEHFAELAELAAALGTDDENLAEAIAGERHESEVLYPEFARAAEAAGDLAAAERFAELADDERAHRRAFEEQLAALRAGR